MTAIYITGTTIGILNITGIIFVLFMLITRSGLKQLKKANMKKDEAVPSLEIGSTQKLATAGATASYDSNMAKEDDILDDLDLSDFDDLDFSDFD